MSSMHTAFDKYVYKGRQRKRSESERRWWRRQCLVVVILSSLLTLSEGQGKSWYLCFLLIKPSQIFCYFNYKKRHEHWIYIYIFIVFGCIYSATRTLPGTTDYCNGHMRSSWRLWVCSWILASERSERNAPEVHMPTCF